MESAIPRRIGGLAVRCEAEQLGVDNDMRAQVACLAKRVAELD
jgi:hypothetical protein